MHPQIRKLEYNLSIHLRTMGIDGFSYFERFYYSVRYPNGMELLVMTTDEYDSSFESRELGEDFEAFTSFDRIIAELENSSEHQTHIQWNRKFPIMLYFDPILIDPNLREKFVGHLRDELSGYDISDFGANEQIQISKWSEKLTAELLSGFR